MLYMAECSYRDSPSETAWNEWYSGTRLDQLLTVPGFRTSQRFKAVTAAESRYLAIHSIDSLAVFASDAYKAIGGGSFKHGQQYITDWKRNVFEGLAIAPAIAIDEYLIIADQRSEQLASFGLNLNWLRVATSGHLGAERGIATVDADLAHIILTVRPCPVNVYVATTVQKRALES